MRIMSAFILIILLQFHGSMAVFGTEKDEISPWISYEVTNISSEAMSEEIATENISSTDNNLAQVGGSFLAGALSSMLLYVIFLNIQRKKMRDLATIDSAIISCATTLWNTQEQDPLESLLEIICQYYKGESAYIYERKANDIYGKSNNLSYYYSDSGGQVKSYQKVLDLGKNEHWKEVMEEREHIFLQKGDSNLSDYPPCDEYLSEIQNKNTLIIPLRVGGNLVGVLGVNNLQQNTKKFQLVNTVSAFISNNLEIAYSKSDLQESVHKLEQKDLEHQAVFQCISTLVYDENPRESIQKLLKIICGYFQGERAYILLKENNELVLMNEYLAHKGIKPSVANFHHISFAVINRWYEEMHFNNTMSVKNAKQEIPEKEHNTKEYGLFLPNESFVSTPIFQNEKIIGFLWVDNPHENIDDPGMLKTISAFIANHLMKSELHSKMNKMSYSDSLTGLYNRNRYMDQYVNQPRVYENMGIIFADVNGLKKANDFLGHEYGDMLLKGCAKFFKTYAMGHVFRIGGDEYVCIVEDTSQRDFEECVDNLMRKMKQHGDVHISIGSLWRSQVTDVEKQVGEADKLMYIEKQKYYAEKRKDTRSEEVQMETFRNSIASLEKELNSVLF